jgi:hypothetical protein
MVDKLIHMSDSAQGIEQIFPHVVHHGIQFPSDKWRHMVTWLRAQIGEPAQSWALLNSSQIRFKRESDALLFSLTWS